MKKAYNLTTQNNQLICYYMPVKEANILHQNGIIVY